MSIQDWINEYIATKGQGAPVTPEFTEASDHPYGCRCDACLRWWVAVGPADTPQGWSFGPFSAVEYLAAGGVIPLHRGDDDEPG